MTAKISSIQDGVFTFSRWWINELKHLEPVRYLFDRVQGPKVIIRWNADGKFAAEYLHRGKKQALGAFELNDQAQSKFPSKIRAASGALRLPANKVLVKSIELPPMAKRDLRQAVGYQISNVSPFKRNEVYFGFRPSQGANGGSKVCADVFVFPSEPIDDAVSELAKLGVKIECIETDDGHVPLCAEADHAPSGSVFSSYKLSLRRVLILLCGLLALSFAGLLDRHLSAKEENFKAASAVLLKEIKTGDKLKTEIKELVERNGHLFKKRLQGVSLTQLLVNLADLLPEGSRLNTISFQDNEVVIGGFTSDGAGLLQKIETSPHFSDARFSSPVVREASAGLERFEISMTALAAGGSE